MLITRFSRQIYDIFLIEIKLIVIQIMKQSNFLLELLNNIYSGNIIISIILQLLSLN